MERDHLGRFASSELDELQVEALDREFSNTLREAALGVKRRPRAPWETRSPALPAFTGPNAGGSRLPSSTRPPRGMNEIIRDAYRRGGETHVEVFMGRDW